LTFTAIESFARSEALTAISRGRARRLTRPRPYELSPLHISNIMGQQLNKIIKRKRRAAYLKRKKARTPAVAKKK